MKIPANDTPQTPHTPQTPPMDLLQIQCDRCDYGVLVEQPIKTAFWRGHSLVVIQNIPAMVCAACGEEYVSDETAIRLDRLRAGDVHAMGSVERLIVPVLDYIDTGPAQ